MTLLYSYSYFEMLLDSEPDHDNSLTSAESVFSCVERKDKFLYPCIMFLIVYMYIGNTKGKGTMLKCVHDLYIRASKNLSPQDRAWVKELLVEHNETTYHDPEKP